MPPDPVFLDSNGLVALLNSRDSLNPTADKLFQELGRVGRPIVLTDWVLAETGNGLARLPARDVFPEAVERFLNSPQFTVVFVSLDLMKRALEFYEERSDKTWGLVDCASFMVMNDHAIQEAFTTDHHFDRPVSGACSRLRRHSRLFINR